jgi:hypothetical protein
LFIATALYRQWFFPYKLLFSYESFELDISLIVSM